MPATPYAKVLVVVNGTAPQSGGIEVPSEATIQLQGQNISAWERARWEIVDYPEDWSTPAGWTKGADGIIYSLQITPPSFDLPTASAGWGKWALRLIVNEQIDSSEKIVRKGENVAALLDDETILSMPDLFGLHDISALEKAQFTTPTTRWKGWIRELQHNFRIISGLLGGVSEGAVGFPPGGASYANQYKKVDGTFGGAAHHSTSPDGYMEFGKDRAGGVPADGDNRFGKFASVWAKSYNGSRDLAVWLTSHLTDAREENRLDVLFFGGLSGANFDSIEMISHYGARFSAVGPADADTPIAEFGVWSEGFFKAIGGDDIESRGVYAVPNFVLNPPLILTEDVTKGGKGYFVAKKRETAHSGTFPADYTGFYVRTTDRHLIQVIGSTEIDLTVSDSASLEYVVETGSYGAGAVATQFVGVIAFTATNRLTDALVAPPAGEARTIHLIVEGTTMEITDDGATIPEEGILLDGAPADYVTGDVVTVTYDHTVERWRVISHNIKTDQGKSVVISETTADIPLGDSVDRISTIVLTTSGETYNDLSSIEAPAAGRSGHIVVLNRAGSYGRIINDTGSTAANRIWTIDGDDYVFPDSGESAAILAYNHSASRWILVSVSLPFVANGDLSGNGASQQVEKIQGVAISGPAALGKVLTSSSSSAASWADPPIARVAGVCYLEDFGGVGDGTTDDGPALAAAATAIAAGTYRCLVLGAKRYKIETFTTAAFNYTSTNPVAVIGQGDSSVLDIDAAITSSVFRITAASTYYFGRFRIEGTAEYSGAGTQTNAGGGSGQHGLNLGTTGLVEGVSFKGLGGNAIIYDTSIGQGPRIIGCRAEQCEGGIYTYNAGDIVAFEAYRCGVGITVGGGNFHLVGADVAYCNVGARVVDATNGAHGTFTGCEIRHNATNLDYQASISNGFVFENCLWYDGALNIGAGGDMVTFLGGMMDCTTYSFAGQARVLDIMFDTDYFVSASVTGEVDFSGCRNLVDGSIPSWIASRPQYIGVSVDGDSNVAELVLGGAVAGHSTGKPFRWKDDLIDLGVTTLKTLTAAEFSNPRMHVTRSGGGSTCEVILPIFEGAMWIVTIDDGVAALEVKFTDATGQPGATVSTGQTKTIVYDIFKSQFVFAN